VLPPAPFPGFPPLRSRIHRALRVDWAGEEAAERIYAAQIKGLGPHHPLGPVLEQMKIQEIEHGKAFEERLVAQGARPSLLRPVWKMAGTLLGTVTAFLGPRATMACTVAVEEVIDTHYLKQIEALGREAPELAAFLDRCREDEVHHKEVGLSHGAGGTRLSRCLQTCIRWGTGCAIKLAERF